MLFTLKIRNACMHVCLTYVCQKCSHFSSLFISRTNTLLLDTHTHTTVKCILCVATYVCMCLCWGEGGILCLTISRSALILSCLVSDVVKNATMDAFQISEGKECCLWHRYMTNSYQQVGGEWGRVQGTVRAQSVEVGTRKQGCEAGLWCTQHFPLSDLSSPFTFLPKHPPPYHNPYLFLPPTR